MEVVSLARTRQQQLQHGSEDEEEGKEDTWVFPLVQMKPLGIRLDEQVTQVSLHRFWVTILAQPVLLADWGG